VQPREEQGSVGVTKIVIEVAGTTIIRMIKLIAKTAVGIAAGISCKVFSVALFSTSLSSTSGQSGDLIYYNKAVTTEGTRVLTSAAIYKKN